MGLFSILKKLFGGKKFKVIAGSDNLFSDVDTEEMEKTVPGGRVLDLIELMKKA